MPMGRHVSEEQKATMRRLHRDPNNPVSTTALATRYQLHRDHVSRIVNDRPRKKKAVQ
jgi:hypothetical protein